MYGPLKIQKQRTRRVQVCCFTTYSTGFDRLSISELQRTSIIGRHFQTIFGKQQREIGSVCKSLKTARLEQQCDDPQGKEGVAWQGAFIRDQKGSEAKQSKLVRYYLAVIGLAPRNGHFQVQFQERRLSGKRIQTSKKWSRRATYSSRKWSKEVSHYSRKWSYAGHLTPSLYSTF